MLAPGDFLIKPAPETPPVERSGEQTPPAPPAPVTEVEEEPRSFLMTLLRALGAIHS